MSILKSSKQGRYLKENSGWGNINVIKWDSESLIQPNEIGQIWSRVKAGLVWFGWIWSYGISIIVGY